jgi:hypothetical protein
MSRTTESSLVRIPADLYQQIAAVAKDDDHSVASTVRALVREGLKRRTITYIGDRDPSGRTMSHKWVQRRGAVR